ncbi:hypothetical protein NGM10_04960 [Halorussus salilacus]|uniref:hypothetical protein n=1 Tax=Halorussus salilacus TaxID=2953750 RepID=UPI00209D8562|nr:hypothetical protein [Halorussus salilacus]USZ69089.1 hypothetical protein NGM10_04960 [Halorussus salilacus]
MARDSDREPSSIEVPCPTCERRWELGRANDRTCPHCGGSVSIRVYEEFALVEREGWAVAVSTADDRPTPGISTDG